MPDIKIEKEKFDALLQKMVETPPLPKSEVKVKPRNKRKKRKKPAA